MTLSQAVQIGPLLLTVDRALALVLISVFLVAAAIVVTKSDVIAERGLTGPFA